MDGLVIGRFCVEVVFGRLGTKKVGTGCDRATQDLRSLLFGMVPFVILSKIVFKLNPVDLAGIKKTVGESLGDLLLLFFPYAFFTLPYPCLERIFIFYR